jgi:peptidoglycan/LPS O-acetylase OafA/YrhL
MSLNRDDNRFDILRLVAAWLVLFSHCYPLGGRAQNEPLASTLGIDTLGGVGVAIFFVLSGYLVTISLERSPSLREFARRRALRIFPGLVAICLLCVLVLGPLLTTLPQSVYWRHSMTWDYLKTASAWLVKYPLPGVFADNPAPHAVNGSLWSLPYEIRCYIVLALVSLVPGSLRLKVSLATAALAVLLLVRPLVPPATPFDKFLGLDYYHTKLGLLFALGAVFACWRERIRPLLWPAALMLVAVYFLGHSVWQLLLYVLGLGTLTLWLALYGKWLPRIPQRVGDWSYGAYLYGFPVQQVLAHFKLHEASFIGYVVACTVVTFALAGLSWHLVEKQALKWK